MLAPTSSFHLLEFFPNFFLSCLTSIQSKVIALKKKGILLPYSLWTQAAVSALSWISSLQPALQISDLSHSQSHVTQFLKKKNLSLLVNIEPIGSLSLETLTNIDTVISHIRTWNGWITRCTHRARVSAAKAESADHKGPVNSSLGVHTSPWDKMELLAVLSRGATLADVHFS